MKRVFGVICALLLSVIIACERRTNEIQSVTQPTHFQSYEIFSSVYQETRHIIVRLPPAYNEDWWNGYNAVYLLDGGYERDFYSALGVLNAEEKGGIIEPLILVGIPPNDRMAEYTPGLDHAGYDQLFPDRGGAAKHLEFIRKDVAPWIEHKFNARGRTIAG